MATPPREDAEVDPLVVDLDRLDGSGPHRLDRTLATAWIASVLDDVDATVPGDGRAELELTVQDDGVVLVRGGLQGEYCVPCARCLAEAHVNYGGEVCTTFVPAKSADHRLSTDEEGLELDAEALDEVPYSGRTLDLRRIVSEQVLLALPMRALCAHGEACAGLCGRCGFDLNDVPAEADRCPSCQAPLSEEAAAADAQAEAQENSPLAQALRKIRDN